MRGKSIIMYRTSLLLARSQERDENENRQRGDEGVLEGGHEDGHRDEAELRELVFPSLGLDP